MLIKRSITTLSTLLVVSHSAPVATVTRYVDGAVPEYADGHPWEIPDKKTLKGISTASDEDDVVAIGRYAESIHFNSRSTMVPSTSPPDADIVDKTMIHGNQRGLPLIFGDEQHGSSSYW